MSANLYTNQSSNVWKTWFLMAGFLAIVLAIAYFLSIYYGNPAILFFGLIFSLVMNFGSFWFSDKIVLKISGARPASREEFFDLYNAVENLSITAGLPMPRVYVMDETAPNAFATGRNKEHAVVCVTTGLLATLNKTELEGVIAHELAHIGNRDILLMTVVVVLVGFITMIADLFFRMNFHGGRDRDSKAGGVMLVIGLVLMILSPIVATVIQLAVSRRREFLADATGAMLTRYPEGLATALIKISASDIPMQKANHATAHLFISEPFKTGRRASFWQKMFMTHPPVEERVAALRGVSVESVMRQ